MELRFPTRPSGNTGPCGFRSGTLAQAVQPPIKAPEEDGPTRVDAGGVAELVTHAGVVRGVDGNVPANDEIRKGEGHERAVKQTASEAGGGSIPIKGGFGAIERPADAEGQGDQEENAAQPPRDAARPRDGFCLCRQMSFRTEQACF